MPCKGQLALLSLLCWACAVRAEEKIEPVDAEFLEYLAEFEGAEEDWTLFEREEPSKKTADVNQAEPPPEPSAPKQSSAPPPKER